jgi:hypothetical protein
MPYPPSPLAGTEVRVELIVANFDVDFAARAVDREEARLLFGALEKLVVILGRRRRRAGRGCGRG